MNQELLKEYEHEAIRRLLQMGLDHQITCELLNFTSIVAQDLLKQIELLEEKIKKLETR